MKNRIYAKKHFRSVLSVVGWVAVGVWLIAYVVAKIDFFTNFGKGNINAYFIRHLYLWLCVGAILAVARLVDKLLERETKADK